MDEGNQPPVPPPPPSSPPPPPPEEPAGPKTSSFQEFFQSPGTGYPPATPEERSWAVGLHISGLAGLVLPGVFNIVAPLVIWLIKRTESRYLDEVGKEVVNYQISWLIYWLITGVIAVITCGFGALLFIPLGIIWLVLVVLAAVKTGNGESYRYPGTIRMIR